MAGNACLNREARGEIPTCEIQGGANDQIWYLCDGLSSDECNPVIGFRLDNRMSELRILRND